ncbi:MAG: Rrf2 family transcriptional regulator [Tissierellia bacterium]|nr:Rrf2 family transcriptional regulator [Tissierellia bacterium]
MQLNISTDYAIRTVIYLSGKDDIANADEISEVVGVSKDYLTKILRNLTKANIVGVQRGVKGGYFLKKDPKDISLYDVIILMEKTININSCLDDEKNCNLSRTDFCQVRKFYISLQEDIDAKMKALSFAELLEETEKASDK